jgi:phosphatidylserine/phosphatidylglycerophosphate/cardiolipin synthase-like enzyme
MNWLSTTQDFNSLTSGIRASGCFRASNPHGGLTQEIESILELAADGDPLRIISPIIDDPGVVDLLCDARKRGVVVRILAPLTDNRGNMVTKGWDASLNVKEDHHEVIRTLAKVGVLLRSPRTTPHTKLVHLDGKKAVFGSANLTKNSLRCGALEAAIVFDDQASLAGTKDAFDFMWKSSPYSMKALAGAVTLDEKSPARHSTESPITSQWCLGDAELFISAPAIGVLSEKLTQLIQGAQSEILLITLSLYDTDTIPGFGAALLAALRRGVHVRAVVRPEHFTLDQYPDPATVELIRHGMELRGITGLHAKGFLIDKQFCGIQSANFNPYSLDSQRAEVNWETAIVGSAQAPMLRDFAAFIERMALNPTHQLVH